MVFEAVEDRGNRPAKTGLEPRTNPDMVEKRALMPQIFVVHGGGTQTTAWSCRRLYFTGFLTIRLSRQGNPSLSAIGFCVQPGPIGNATGPQANTRDLRSGLRFCGLPKFARSLCRERCSIGFSQDPCCTASKLYKLQLYLLRRLSDSRLGHPLDHSRRLDK
jgi:hypothetical protein